MRWFLFILLMIVVSLRRSTSAQEKPAEKENPFGVMIGAPKGMDIETKMKAAKALGAVYYRTATAIFIGAWKGFHAEAEAEAAEEAGLKLVLTVRTGDGPGEPSGPPKDMETYKRVIGEVIDKYKPVLLVVENEENSMALFYTGSPEEYHRQLKAACEVAHAKGVKCANGGLVSSLVIALTADRYAAEGEEAKAEKFLRRALDDDHYKKLTRGGTKAKEQLQRGKDLLKGYKAAGVDYVNFHWYSDDPEALPGAVRYLEETTGLPALCNEMGQQKNTSPEQVTNMLAKSIEIGLPIVIWYSIDTPAYGEAKGLTEPDGLLRDNGKAFRKFISTHFPER